MQIDSWRQFVERARRERPELRFSTEELLAFAGASDAEHAPPDPDFLHAGDLLLAHRCEAGDPHALRVFETEVLAQLGGTSLPHGASWDEVRQDLRVLLLVPTSGGRARIRGYRGRGSLFGWVRTIARRIAFAGKSVKYDRLEEVGPELSEFDTPEYLYASAEQCQAFKRKFEQAAVGLEEAERSLLRLYYVDGANVDAISRRLSVSRSTVGRRLQAVHEKLHGALGRGHRAADASAFDQMNLGHVLSAASRH